MESGGQISWRVCVCVGGGSFSSRACPKGLSEEVCQDASLTWSLACHLIRWIRWVDCSARHRKVEPWL